jgi:hypothetical protein
VRRKLGDGTLTSKLCLAEGNLASRFLERVGRIGQEKQLLGLDVSLFLDSGTYSLLIGVLPQASTHELAILFWWLRTGAWLPGNHRNWMWPRGP